MNIQPVPVEFVNASWEVVEPFIQSAIEHSNGDGLYSIDNIRGHIASGQWLLLVAVDDSNTVCGAATIAITNYPKHRVAFVTTIGGKLITSKDTYAQFKAILKANGCTLIQAYGRESIVRLWKRYDFTPKQTLMEAPL